MSDEKKLPAPIAPTSIVPTAVPIGPSTSLDLSFLPEGQRQALLTDYARGVLNISQKAQELHVDVGVLGSTLRQLAETTKDISDSGNAVTITHTQTTAIGRTEIMMGNTQQAQSGKLNRSQSGLGDWTPYYVIGALIALVVIIALLAK